MARLIGIWQTRFVRPEDVNPETDERLSDTESMDLAMRFSQILNYKTPPEGMTHEQLEKAQAHVQTVSWTHERTVAVKRRVT